MSKRVCQNCQKASMWGNVVSHSKQRAKRVYRPNLHKTTLWINGVKKKMLLCTRCIRQLKTKNTPRIKKNKIKVDKKQI